MLTPELAVDGLGRPAVGRPGRDRAGPPRRTRRRARRRRRRARTRPGVTSATWRSGHARASRTAAPSARTARSGTSRRTRAKATSHGCGRAAAGDRRRPHGGHGRLVRPQINSTEVLRVWSCHLHRCAPGPGVHGVVRGQPAGGGTAPSRHPPGAAVRWTAAATRCWCCAGSATALVLAQLAGDNQVTLHGVPLPAQSHHRARRRGAGDARHAAGRRLAGHPHVTVDGPDPHRPQPRARPHRRGEPMVVGQAPISVDGALRSRDTSASADPASWR